MPAIGELLRNLWGAWRLLLLDRHGILAYDGSRQAALRSFWVVLLSLPISALTVALLLASGNEGLANGLASLAADCTIAWLLPLLVIYALVRWYGRGERYWLLLTALNWSQVPQGLLGLLRVGLLIGAGVLIGPDSAPDTASASVLIGVVIVQLAWLVYIAIVFYEWFVAWIALEAGFALPTAAVLFDLVINYGLSYGIDQLWPPLPLAS